MLEKDPLPESPESSLEPFFRPRTVAVIGASHEPGTLGFRLLDCLLRGGFHGSIFPVNPRAGTILGLRTYPSVLAIDQAIDLAMVVVPAQVVLKVVEECCQRGIKALVVISAGFAETGGTGKDLQDRVAEVVRASGARLIGPNCLGLVANAPDVQLNATFVPIAAPSGKTAVSSDSGALGLAVLFEAARLGMGVSSFVSVGNRADVSSNDLLEYWEQVWNTAIGSQLPLLKSNKQSPVASVALSFDKQEAASGQEDGRQDPKTQLILLYLESFGNPRRFARIARRVSRSKPIVAVKAGRTRAGQRAAGSHTAALAVGDVPVDALFHQSGIIRAETLQEMFAVAALIDGQPLPRGNRVGIVTNAGGPAILCADACEAGGLVVPEFSESTQLDLAAFLPRSAGLKNPVDMIASATPEHYRRALRVLLGSGEIDALIAIYVSPDLSVPDALKNAIRETVASVRADTPVLACLMPENTAPVLNVSPCERIPCYAFPEMGAQALGKVVRYAQWRSQAVGKAPDFRDVDWACVRAICQQALCDRSGGWLSAEETRSLLIACGLPIAAGGLARTRDQAAALARNAGFPVAVKLASSQIVHKTEMGCVHLNLGNEDAVKAAFDEICNRLARDSGVNSKFEFRNSNLHEGVLVQPMVHGGTEVMVGVTEDPVFGPLVAFGLGGIHVEILGDVSFRVTPLDDEDARQMIAGIRGARLFAGYRGHPPADLPAIEDVLLRVSTLVENVPVIRELDLNPIIVLPPGQGCRIVDARVRVAL